MSNSTGMLRLLSLLQTHRHSPCVELAGRLEDSDRTLRRDVDRPEGSAIQCGPSAEPGAPVRGGAAMPPLLHDDEEAVAIVVSSRRPVAWSRASRTPRCAR